MGVTTWTNVTLVADGADEEAAVSALSEMLVKDIF